MTFILDTMKPFKIVILSGKGGTGKTFVAVNLVMVAKEAIYFDCDVEEPNGNLFFQTNQVKVEEVSVQIPVIDHSKCNGCRICSDFCAFNALAFVKDKILVLEDLCHSCGGCTKLCMQKAIAFKPKSIGTISKGFYKQVEVITGSLNLHYPSGVKIIEKMFEEPAQQPFQIIDCPPGSSCLVIECVKQSDFCFIVAEDTIFGLHNMNMVYELVKLFHKPHAVMINKKINANIIEPFCEKNQIPMLPSILFDHKIARTISEGRILVEEDLTYHLLFEKILQSILEYTHETTTCS